MAPRPSEFSKCSTIQRWAALIPRCRQEPGAQRSIHLKTRSTPRKKLDQETRPSRFLARDVRPSMNSSPIPRSGSIRRTGLKCDMIESGTTIVRVQADIALRLKLSREGMRTSSGGTLGHSS